jgi:hypothetical protein
MKSCASILLLIATTRGSSITHHRPTLDAILDHKVLDKRCMGMDHVVPVSLIGETGLFVAANRKAKKLL